MNERRGIFKRIKRYGIARLVKQCWYFSWGHVFGFLFYKRKYYFGKWFISKHGNLHAPGWEWMYNPGVPWPCSEYIRVGKPQNIHFHPDDLNNFMGFGNYYQTMEDGHIYIGKGTYIAMNVGIITTNHDVLDPDKHVEAKNVVIGEKCWIGMNSVILPGVNLGDHTVVGAGAVVTKSFPEGHCVIGGNPAHVIRRLNETDNG